MYIPVAGSSVSIALQNRRRSVRFEAFRLQNYVTLVYDSLI